MYELITEKTLPEYEQFIQSHRQGHFAQSSLWGKQKTAWQFRAVAVRGENGAIKGALGVLIRKAPVFPVSMLYICRGPVCESMRLSRRLWRRDRGLRCTNEE